MPATPAPVPDNDDRLAGKSRQVAVSAVVVAEPFGLPRFLLNADSSAASSPAAMRAVLCVWRT